MADLKAVKSPFPLSHIPFLASLWDTGTPWTASSPFSISSPTTTLGLRGLQAAPRLRRCGVLRRVMPLL
jgi:hypothetical protein